MEKNALSLNLAEEDYTRSCNCPPRQINCMTPREWVLSQIGVWRFKYQKNDIRDKKIHPAMFPIDLPKKCIELFTHKGELVLDPFSGAATTAVAAKELSRNSVGFDLKEEYPELGRERLNNIPEMALFSKVTEVE